MKQKRRFQMKSKTLRRLMIVCFVGILTFGLNAEANVTEGYIYFMGGGTWYRMVGSGDAAPLILIHGGPGANHHYFEPLESIADERPVIVYDQRGCGNSDPLEDPNLWTLEFYVEELRQVIAQLGLERVHVLGHSWGSAVAVEYALTQPEELVSLLPAGPFMSTAIWIEDQREYIKTLPEDMQEAIYHAEQTGEYSSPEYQAAMDEYYVHYLCRLDPWPEPLILTFANMNNDLYVGMWGPSEFTCTGTLYDHDQTSQLHMIDVPTLFTCGRYDEAPPETTAYYMSLIPDAKMKVFNKSSHTPMLEQPHQYIKVIRNFLNKVEKKEKKKKHK
jgi:proline-specific peptidase